jgi:hypothetical protein
VKSILPRHAAVNPFAVSCDRNRWSWGSRETCDEGYSGPRERLGCYCLMTTSFPAQSSHEGPSRSQAHLSPPCRSNFSAWMPRIRPRNPSKGRGRSLQAQARCSCVCWFDLADLMAAHHVISRFRASAPASPDPSLSPHAGSSYSPWLRRSGPCLYSFCDPDPNLRPFIVELILRLFALRKDVIFGIRPGKSMVQDLRTKMASNKATCTCFFFDRRIRYY